MRRVANSAIRATAANSDNDERSPAMRAFAFSSMIEQFNTLLEAQVLVADWRQEYNTYRPHSALGMLSPAGFAAQWRQTSQLQLS